MKEGFHKELYLPRHVYMMLNLRHGHETDVTGINLFLNSF